MQLVKFETPAGPIFVNPENVVSVAPTGDKHGNVMIGHCMLMFVGSIPAVVLSVSAETAAKALGWIDPKTPRLSTN